MATRRLHAYATERDNEVILGVDLWSDTKRLQSKTSGYVIKVGVAGEGDDGGVDWIGVWDQTARGMPRRTKIQITGNERLHLPLEVGKVCVVEIAEYGAPSQGAEGITALWRFARIGELGGVSGRRLDDPDKPRPRAVKSPLFALGKHIFDQGIRHAVEPLVDTLNDSGLTEFVVALPLVAAGDSENVACDSDYDAAVGVAPTNATFVVGSTITLTPPESQRQYRVAIHGGASLEDPGTATMGGVRIYDTTAGAVVGPTQMRCGTSGGAAGTEIASATVGDEAYILARGSGAHTFELQVNLQAGGPAQWIDSWISGRLIPDPQSVP